MAWYMLFEPNSSITKFSLLRPAASPNQRPEGHLNVVNACSTMAGPVRIWVPIENALDDYALARAEFGDSDRPVAMLQQVVLFHCKF